MKIFPVLGRRNRKKRYFKGAGTYSLIYTPKEAHSRIFVTGGSVFARQILAKKKYFGGRPVCIYNDYQIIIEDRGGTASAA